MTSVAALATPAAPVALDTLDTPGIWTPLGLTPQRALRVLGMRRSGNHAICNWLQRNAPEGRALFLNNCRAGGDPFRSHRAIEVSGQRFGNDLTEAATAAGEGALLLVSYEDSSHVGFGAERPLSGPLPDAAFDAEILIYRSPLNWLASLLRKLQDNPGYGALDRLAILTRALATYNALLAEVLEAPGRGAVPICYDTWVADELSRERLLQRLGLPCHDNGLGAVQSFGGGPTFQKEARAPQELTPGTRWQEMAADAEYQALLRLLPLDLDLMARLAALFPEEAARLDRIARRPLFDAEDLA